MRISGSIQGTGTLSGVLQIPVGITPGDVPIVGVTVSATGTITAVTPMAGGDKGVTTMGDERLLHMSGDPWATMGAEVTSGGMVADADAKGSDGIITDVTSSAETT